MLSMDERVAFELRYALYLAAIGNVQKRQVNLASLRLALTLTFILFF
jgi:hypothetical protein